MTETLTLYRLWWIDTSMEHAAVQTIEAHHRTWVHALALLTPRPPNGTNVTTSFALIVLQCTSRSVGTPELLSIDLSRHCEDACSPVTGKASTLLWPLHTGVHLCGCTRDCTTHM